jgi:hypothetical protein
MSEMASRVRLVGTLVTLAVLSVTGCSSDSIAAKGAPSSSPSSACVVSRLEPGPGSFAPYGLAHAGPLWFSAFGRVAAGAPAQLAGGGPLDGWKLVVHPDPASSGVVELSGTDCATGAIVRFCYGGCSWDSRLQASVAVLGIDAGAHLDYTGYMLFPASGLMRLTVTTDGKPSGQSVILVPPPT